MPVKETRKDQSSRAVVDPQEEECLESVVTEPISIDGDIGKSDGSDDGREDLEDEATPIQEPLLSSPSHVNSCWGRSGTLHPDSMASKTRRGNVPRRFPSKRSLADILDEAIAIASDFGNHFHDFENTKQR